MLFHTHLAFGFLSGLIAARFMNIGNKYIFFALVLLGALLADIDEPNSKISSKIKLIGKITRIFTKHRGIFHSLFIALLIPGLVYYFIGHTYGAALFIGYLSHLIIDGFTKAGINFLYPVGTLRLQGFIETGKLGEHLLFAAIVVLIVIILKS